MDKSLGAVYTPEKIARFLVTWAIQKRSDKILDAGAGEGIFVRESAKRLQELGISKTSSMRQIFAIEYDNTTFMKLKDTIERDHGIQSGQNFINADFFNIWPDIGNIPRVDVVVGNPPYVERQLIPNVAGIRKRLSEKHPELRLNGSTDIYGYFIIHAADFLKAMGRMALIVSDTWMNMDFGVAIRRFLLNHFKIKAIIGFDRRIFPNVLVRSVLLLLEMPQNDECIGTNKVAFVQLSDSQILEKLIKNMEVLDKEQDGNDFRVAIIGQEKLNSSMPWTIYMKSPTVYFKAVNHPLMVKLSMIARANIGVQTLRREFFIIQEEDRKKRGLEPKFFEPIIVSPRNTPPVVDDKDCISSFVLYCDTPKSKLIGTKLLHYIEEAERKKVTTRGKGTSHIGIHNIPRIVKAGRDPWYNIKPEIDRRCRGSILMPRRIYEKYLVTWNKLILPANDDFIVVKTHNQSHVIPLLAILNSSIIEFFVRVLGHIYGGGVCDLRPDDVKNLPVINVNALDDKTLDSLKMAYKTFINSNGSNRSSIDSLVQRILNLPESLSHDITRDYNKILGVSLLAKK